jgi:3-hydroxyisobutyrate dehydrogenase
METVGFIGLGNMGSGMAGNIQKADYPLVVYDIRQEVTRRFASQGARPANSPAEVARLSDVTFTSLPGPQEVEEVAIGDQGVLEGIKPGGIYVDLSTSRPTLIPQVQGIVAV